MIRRLALYAHYDATSRVRPFVVHHLQKLREDCDAVVFVSTAPLPQAELAQIAPFVADVILRDNVGYDFGMWQAALARHDLGPYDELVLSNSSCFGPIASLGPIFARMSARPCDVWGMTDNSDIAWHLQSYFLVFKARAFRRPEFAAFWQGILPFKTKRQVIRSYEVGLSVLLADHGLALEAFAPLEALPRLTLWDKLSRKRRVHNPPCAYPLELIEYGMPLVKVELFRDNPLEVDLRAVRRAIEAHGYDMRLLSYDRPRAPDATRLDRARRPFG